MGGWSGGRGRRGKDTTTDMRSLDVRRLQRDGLLTPGRCFYWKWSHNGEEVSSIQIKIEADRVVLNYRSRSFGGEWHPMEYPVYLEWTDCNFGGRRVWFRCPARGCGRRVAILYGGTVFACRHCHDLAYQCQRETGDDRAMRRAETIRQRLGWEPGIANPRGGKPDGMHWRTFERLKAQHDAHVAVSLAGMAQWLGLIGHGPAGDEDPFNDD